MTKTTACTFVVIIYSWQKRKYVIYYDYDAYF